MQKSIDKITIHYNITKINSFHDFVHVSDMYDREGATERPYPYNSLDTQKASNICNRWEYMIVCMGKSIF